MDSGQALAVCEGRDYKGMYAKAQPFDWAQDRPGRDQGFHGDRRPVRGAGARRDRAGYGEAHAGGERSRAKARIIVDYLIGQGLVRKPAQVGTGSGDGRDR